MKHLITIDWGTSSFRATRWQCGPTFHTSHVLEQLNNDYGLLQLPVNAQGKKDFEGCLAVQLEPWLTAATTSEPGIILMSGMVGSKTGWQEAPYCSTPANVQSMARACTRVVTSHRALNHWQCNIAPGVSQLDPADVMRGEETQLLGCQQDLSENNSRSNDSQVFVMPGTHSKHVWMQGSVITKFATIMTGELFALISEQSILKPVIEAQAKLEQLHTTEASRLSFLDGFRCSLDSNEPLLQRIFSLRAQALLNAKPHLNTRDQLSGILIGDELKALQNVGRPVNLVGQKSLCERYMWACSELGLQTNIFDSQAAERGALKLFLALHSNHKS